MDKRIHEHAEKIWHYHHLNHKLENADAILVLCSHDTVVAERGAEIFLEGYAPLLIFSGGFGSVTKGMWTQPEAEKFAKIAVEMGVSENKILIENKSTNTGENVLFTKKLLEEKGINPQKFILVQKPYMERRTYATFKKLWSEKDILVTSPQLSFDEYLNKYAGKELSKDYVISILVGDLQRIKIYPQKGFQIYQDIPDDVWSAFEELVKAGYDKHLIKEVSV